MVSKHAYEYSLLRVVPRIERGEAINAGVLLYCRALDYLGARVHLEADRLRVLDPAADADRISAALQGIVDVCTGTSPSPAAVGDIGRRFRWLTAPRSTIIQTSTVHTGLTGNPAAEADHLFGRLVLPLDEPR